jgi:hypothetical protein
MNQSKPEDPMAWHAQIAETDSEVKQERAYQNYQVAAAKRDVANGL